MLRRYMWNPGWRRTFYGFNGGRRMPLDVRADDEAYVITAEMPGLKREEIKIDILDDVVTLHGEAAVEENGHGVALWREIPELSTFNRRLRLPEPVDAEGAEAMLENGLLTVRIPKAESARPKTIEIKSK